MTKDEEDQVIYADALLNRGKGTCLGPAFARAWPVVSTPSFVDLLAAIDDADSSSPRLEGSGGFSA